MYELGVEDKFRGHLLGQGLLATSILDPSTVPHLCHKPQTSRMGLFGSLPPPKEAQGAPLCVPV